MKKLFSLGALIISGVLIFVSTTPVLAQNIGDYIYDYPYADITANGSFSPYVQYGDNVTIEWDSYGMSSCEAAPIGHSGLEGSYLIENVTSNLEVTLDCEVGPSFPDWHYNTLTIRIKVLPPTFSYFTDYLLTLENQEEKLKLNSVSAFIRQAQRTLDSGDIDKSVSFLQKSADSLERQVRRSSISSDDVEQYRNALSYFTRSLGIKVEIAADGCSVTAIGTEGLLFNYGANFQERKGWGGQTVIPESGTVTESTHASAGWNATGEITDSEGVVYTRESQEVNEDCPLPPIFYDPSVYYGYPEKWGAPEPGTVTDDWGYLNRTAESYIAFRVSDSSRTFPSGYGEASQWLDLANEDENVIVDNTPQAGDVAFNTFVVDEPDPQFQPPIIEYVESVDEDGTVHTSAISSSGTLQESWGSVDSFGHMTYIRFP